MFNRYGVIFDMDGVLADTGPIHFESWAKLAKEIGYEFTKDFFNQTFGQQSTTITRKLVGPTTSQKLVEKWANLKEKYYRDMVKNKLKALPGALKIIRELKSKGFKLAIGSSGPRENVELLINTLDLKDYFDVLVTAAEVKNGKPSPDVFIISAEKMHIEPKKCIVIEDAPVGIEAAKKANMKVIGLTTTHEKKELKGADLVLLNLSYLELKDIINLLKIT